MAVWYTDHERLVLRRAKHELFLGLFGHGANFSEGLPEIDVGDV